MKLPAEYFIKDFSSYRLFFISNFIGNLTRLKLLMEIPSAFLFFFLKKLKASKELNFFDHV